MIARSIVNKDAMNNEEDGVEDEEPDEEYHDDVATRTRTSMTTTRAVAALATISINEGNNDDTAKKCANK